MQDSAEVCEFCQAIVDDVRKFVTNKKTEVVHYVYILNNVCGFAFEVDEFCWSKYVAAACILLIFIEQLMQRRFVVLEETVLE